MSLKIRVSKTVRLIVKYFPMVNKKCTILDVDTVLWLCRCIPYNYGSLKNLKSVTKNNGISRNNN